MKDALGVVALINRPLTVIVESPDEVKPLSQNEMGLKYYIFCRCIFC